MFFMLLLVYLFFIVLDSILFLFYYMGVYFVLWLNLFYSGLLFIFWLLYSLCLYLLLRIVLMNEYGWVVAFVVCILFIIAFMDV